MKILVTGSAGFIGSALSIKLLERGDEVIGIDNHNDYYDPALKEARLHRHENNNRYERRLRKAVKWAAEMPWRDNTMWGYMINTKM